MGVPHSCIHTPAMSLTSIRPVTGIESGIFPRNTEMNTGYRTLTLIDDDVCVRTQLGKRFEFEMLCFAGAANQKISTSCSQAMRSVLVKTSHPIRSVRYLDHTQTNMGRGEKYERDEREAIAEAYKYATLDDRKGADQDINLLKNRMIDKLKEIRPHPPAGKYWERGGDKIHSYWRDNIQKDINRFTFDLQEAHAACTTGGISEDELDAIAVAKHMGKSEHCQYNYRDFKCDAWENWRAFCVVRYMRKFQLDVNSPARRPSEEESYYSDGSEREIDSESPAVAPDDEDATPPRAQARGEGATAVGAAATSSAASSQDAGRARPAALESRASKANEANTSKSAKTSPKTATKRSQQDKHSRRGGRGRDTARRNKEKEEQRNKREKQRKEVISLTKQRMEQKKKEDKVRLLQLGYALNKDGNNERAAKCKEALNALVDEELDAANSASTSPPTRQSQGGIDGSPPTQQSQGESDK